MNYVPGESTSTSFDSATSTAALSNVTTETPDANRGTSNESYFSPLTGISLNSVTEALNGTEISCQDLDSPNSASVL